MNYLGRNLNNSLILPFDVMKLIYEYADPLNAVRKQIENKDYNLDEIMYKRMKKHIVNNQFFYDIDIIEFLDKSNIIEIYKNTFFSSLFYRENIFCFPNDFSIEIKKSLMINQLLSNNVYKCRQLNDNKYKMKNVYKKWLKL